ncbi:hypothetical protein GX645_06075 [Candidatus Sumerlaeota bacterium]|nr:hypothetical protein [Candidatus Sumerlaeota bacterium]
MIYRNSTSKSDDDSRDDAETSFRAVCESRGVNLESFDEWTMEGLIDIYQKWFPLFRMNDELAAFTAFDIRLHRMRRYRQAYESLNLI